MTVSADRRSRFAGALPYVLLVLTMLLWSGNFIVGRGARDEVPPIALAFWRWVVAAVVLLPLAWSDLGRARHEIIRHWRLLLGLSLTGVAAYNPLLYSGLRATTAINAALLLATTPILIALSSRIFLRRSCSALQWTGISASLLGTLVIISRGSLSHIGDISLNPGDPWVMAAVPVWAIFTVLLARRPASLSPLLTQFVITVAGLALLLPLYASELAAGRTMIVSKDSLEAIAYLGIVASVVAYVLWNRSVQAVGPTRAGMFLYLIPVFSAALSTLLLGESVQLFHLAGAALIFLGLGLASWSRPARESRPTQHDDEIGNSHAAMPSSPDTGSPDAR